MCPLCEYQATEVQKDITVSKFCLCISTCKFAGHETHPLTAALRPDLVLVYSTVALTDSSLSNDWNRVG
jgi:hypothetical protein